MLLPVFVSLTLAAEQPAAKECPQQPEPPALTSASFEVPAAGDTLLFSAAPSFQSVRYALRVVKPAGSQTASASLVRLKRRFDCNVHDRTGEWQFKLSPSDTDALFATAAAFERLDHEPPEIALDGTWVEVQRFSNGKQGFSYSSNGLKDDQLSNLALELVRRNVPTAELPKSTDWRYEPPTKGRAHYTQLQGVSSAEADELVSILLGLQKKLKSGEGAFFELLSGAPASYPMTEVSPRRAFLDMPFEKAVIIERVPTDNQLWQPFKLIYAPNGPGQLIWEVQLVLGHEKNVERVEMIYRPPPPF